MAKSKILLVEDEAIVALEVKDRLQNMGYTVVDIISHGEDVYEAAQRTNPDLILMDIKLKGPVDGIEAATHIRTELDIPVIYLTAYSNDELRDRALKSCPSGYIIKPFKEIELNILIKLALQKHVKDKKFIEITGNLQDKIEHSRSDLAEANKRLEEQIQQSRLREQEIERNYEIQKIISKVLRTSLEPISIKEHLQRTLELILSVSWLALEKKGSIFLTIEGKEELEMVAWHGLGENLIEICGILPFGYCLCGRAALTRKLVFSDCLDERHDVRFDGMQPHGHYCVPIISGEKILGVINMYVRHGHTRDERADDFLNAIADTLAGIIERRSIQRKLRHMALYDNLTGIPNRTMFFDRLGQSIALAKRHNRTIVLFYLDLDKFKHINDTLGHDAGDELLKETARRLQSCLRESDTAARMGGDEFTVILTEVASEADAAAVANKVIETLQVPFELKGYLCSIGTSIGISIYPTSANEASALIKKADMAMYAAKTSGRGTYQFYSGEQVTFDLLVDYAVKFVMFNNGKWDHNKWLSLLFDIQRRGFDLSDTGTASLGLVLESLKPMMCSTIGKMNSMSLINLSATSFIQKNDGKWDSQQLKNFHSDLVTNGIKLNDETTDMVNHFLESLKTLYSNFHSDI
ncbi:diguanylate cyclase domain-containing protein [Candidatus Magnetominusculus xianensis]|uniref:Multi-sensor signal transduction histidine kinase n=1 Tax=Candidatus Magnetominusculus xianensis TaxID=1748249 RepID=A0ABR5SDX5_9BACT|nr:diguanylate cyclase [Candidatus Magnetominusculus xianensis]KWT83502.1 multi-sensor signal transduction histidine kinase [Candidatus Magnetominusculus xianensis]MBF0405606.1 diguanylate cyclase [Nitrospirota bacterium]